MDLRPGPSAQIPSSSDGTSVKNAAITEIQASIKPKIMDLIRRQRIGHLMTGTVFPKYSPKGQRVKDKFWFCRLSSSQDALLYGDCDSKDHETRQLNNKLPICEIKELMIGRECPHLRDTRSRKGPGDFSFCLIRYSDQDDGLHFVMSDEKTFCIWIDGLNALLGREISSKEANSDMDAFISMHMAIQLLELDGVPLPHHPPQVPPLPPNFDFALKY